MDSELAVSQSESEKGRKEHKPSSLSEYFERLCPFYIEAGMTYDEYWNGDSCMATSYRKAKDMRIENQNFFLWLQGRYFYDALCCVAPILRAFSKAKKPVDYHEQPLTLNTSYSEIRKKQKQAESDNKAKQMMEAFAVQFNKKFLEKKGGTNHG